MTLKYYVSMKHIRNRRVQEKSVSFSALQDLSASLFSVSFELCDTAIKKVNALLASVSFCYMACIVPRTRWCKASQVWASHFMRNVEIWKQIQRKVTAMVGNVKSCLDPSDSFQVHVTENSTQRGLNHKGKYWIAWLKSLVLLVLGRTWSSKSLGTLGLVCFSFTDQEWLLRFLEQPVSCLRGEERVCLPHRQPKALGFSWLDQFNSLWPGDLNGANLGLKHVPHSRVGPWEGGGRC